MEDGYIKWTPSPGDQIPPDNPYKRTKKERRKYWNMSAAPLKIVPFKSDEEWFEHNKNVIPRAIS